MALINKVTSIRISDEILSQFELANSYMGDIADELEELAREEDRYQDLYECAYKVYANLNDFLATYAERDL